MGRVQSHSGTNEQKRVSSAVAAHSRYAIMAGMGHMGVILSQHIHVIKRITRVKACKNHYCRHAVEQEIRS